MQTDVVEKISSKVKRLSAKQQEEVLGFVERLEPTRRTLWDMVKDRVGSIPDDVLQNLPSDGAENHDHYLYGAPKK